MKRCLSSGALVMTIQGLYPHDDWGSWRRYIPPGTLMVVVGSHGCDRNLYKATVLIDNIVLTMYIAGPVSSTFEVVK